MCPGGSLKTWALEAAAGWAAMPGDQPRRGPEMQLRHCGPLCKNSTGHVFLGKSLLLYFTYISVQKAPRGESSN